MDCLMKLTDSFIAVVVFVLWVAADHWHLLPH